MSGHLEHKLLELIHKKETELGRRLLVAEIATGAGVSKKLVYRWLKSNKGIGRYDEDVIAGFCSFFGCKVEDLLIYIEDEEES